MLLIEPSKTAKTLSPTGSRPMPLSLQKSATAPVHCRSAAPHEAAMPRGMILLARMRRSRTAKVGCGSPLVHTVSTRVMRKRKRKRSQSTQRREGEKKRRGRQLRHKRWKS